MKTSQIVVMVAVAAGVAAVAYVVLKRRAPKPQGSTADNATSGHALSQGHEPIKLHFAPYKASNGQMVFDEAQAAALAARGIY